jgi:hypothetical protein
MAAGPPAVVAATIDKDRATRESSLAGRRAARLWIYALAWRFLVEAAFQRVSLPKSQVLFRIDPRAYELAAIREGQLAKRCRI